MSTEINPYGFYPIDWHWTIWAGILHVGVPGLAYLAYNQWWTSSQNRIDYLLYITMAYAAVWSPLFLLALFVS